MSFYRPDTSTPSHFTAVSQMLRIPNASNSSTPPDVLFALQKLLVIDNGASRYIEQTMATIGSKARQFWHHPAGPKTIHVTKLHVQQVCTGKGCQYCLIIAFDVQFWAPTFKWGISIANVADFKRPAEQVSYPQQCAVTATGLIWSRFATQITPVSVLHHHSPCCLSQACCM